MENRNNLGNQAFLKLQEKNILTDKHVIFVIENINYRSCKRACKNIYLEWYSPWM